MKTTHFHLLADASELEKACDVEEILKGVVEAMDLSLEEKRKVQDEWTKSPCKIAVVDGDKLNTAVTVVGGRCDKRVKGATFSPYAIWVLRLDWPALLAHEICHAIQRVLGEEGNEREARRVEDAF